MSSLELRRSALLVRKAQVERMPAELKAEVLKEMAAGLEPVAAAIKRNAPVSEDKDPGQLRDSVHSFAKDGRVGIVAGGKEAPHAWHVEYGTRFMRAISFFWTTWRLMRAKVMRIPNKVLNRMAKKYGA